MAVSGPAGQIEGLAAGVTWSAENWLQYPDGRPFPSLAHAG
jgi:hypothetical protein